MPKNPTREVQDKPFVRYRENFKRKTKPEDKEPKMPTSVSAMNGDKLGDLMIRYSAWREYADDCVQDAFVEYMQSKNKYDYQWELLFLQTAGKSIKDREMIVNCDVLIRKLKVDLEDAEMYHQLLLNKLDSFTNCLTIISREITRRSN